MKTEAYLELMRQLGLTPLSGMGTPSNWLCKTRDGDFRLVRKPFDLADEERAAEAKAMRDAVDPFAALQ